MEDNETTPVSSVGPETSRRKPPVIIVLVLLAAVLIGVKVSRAGQVSLERVTDLTTIDFPAGSRVFHSNYRETEQSKRLLAIVEFKRSDAEAFVRAVATRNQDRSSISTTDKLGLVDNILANGRTPKWWNPDSVKQFMSMSVMPMRDDGTTIYVKLVVSLDGKDKSKVYIFWTS